jgi:hypothetical protein
MLPRGVEHEPRARFDRDVESALIEQRAECADLIGASALGVQVVNVRRERDAVVAEVGEDPDGILEPVEGEAVRVVEETTQRRSLLMAPNRFAALRIVSAAFPK